MTNLRRIFQMTTAAALTGATLASGQMGTSTSRLDPANLAGEHVPATTTVRKVSANQGSAALWQDLLRLKTRASLMMIVAHPDDEDGGMLTYETRGQGVHAAMLTLTRGEGGQNIMSGDFDAALGLVRTQELLAADRYLHVNQLWGTEIDFGFSKTKEESFQKWGYDRVLYDAVRAVRLYRPLVMTAVFIGGLTDGHGQHQVSGEIAQEVFEKAGDPKVFPEMGLPPWKPLKVYARVPFFSISSRGMYDYATGKYAPVRFYNYVTKQWSTKAPEANVVIPEGTYSPILGMTYLQFARMGLGLQKTQNGGMGVPSASPFNVPYHRYGSEVPAAEHEKSFFDGIDTSLTGMASLAPSENTFLRQGLEKLNETVRSAMERYSATEPQRIAPLLREGLQETDTLLSKVEASHLTPIEKYNLHHELSVKRVQFNDALVQALGLSLRAEVAPEHELSGRAAIFRDSSETLLSAVPGQQLGVNVLVVDGNGIPLKVRSCTVASSTGEQYRSSQPSGDATLDATHVYSDRVPVNLPETAPLTRPPFVQPSVEQPYYDVAPPGMRNASLPLYPLTADVQVDYDGVPILLKAVVQTAHRETGWGTVYQPLLIVPPISVSISPNAGIVPLSEKTFRVTAQVRSEVQGTATGTVHLELPQGWRAVPADAPFSITKKGDSTEIPFAVTPEHLSQSPYTMTAVAQFRGKEYREGYRQVGYPGLQPANLYQKATYRTRGVDVKVAHSLRVGYLPGTGDSVEASLEDLGIHAATLTMADILSGRLSGYDAVVLGVRAYSAHLELPAATNQLLQYARNGGVVIVQYNTPEYDHNFGPYPYQLGGAEKVVDEDAPVKVLHPDNPLMSWPNHITSKDFDGWVEERGHSFMESWDPHYVALTETHDPGQDPQNGGLLYAKTGKGAYIYVAYALYRQLPEGVPGAYRLFANLLSVGKNPYVTSKVSGSNPR